MSEVAHTTPAAPVEHSLEHAAEPTSVAHETPVAAESSTEAVPTLAAPTADDAVTAEDHIAPPTTEATTTESALAPAAAAPVEDGKKEVKAVEPVSEGVLGYKAPGLLKQFTFSKKEFWLSDEPVTPQHLDLYLRGEKSEVSHPVVAWASQSGKGLLFFGKKGETVRTHPAGVLPLYEATDLKKQTPHEFSFELHGHKHQFKATSDAERDGWYMALEKAIEIGKATKESVRGGEGYKSEMEKLNTPNAIGGAAIPSKARGQSQPKKSSEAAGVARVGSSEGEEEAAAKSHKSRSTSRGVLARLQGKKEELEAKKEEKKIEHAETKSEPAVVIPGTAVALDAPSTAERAVGAPIVDHKVEEPLEATTIPEAESKTVEEKPKVSKRGSIFGKLPSAWNSIKSPTKERSEKEAELAPQVPPKDIAVAESAPQLPETATTEPIETTTAPVVVEPTHPEIVEPAATETPKAADVLTPGKEKKNFLSGLPFLNKRDRSVSPSAAVKDTPVKTETPVTETVAPVESVKADEPVAPTATEPVAAAESAVPAESALEKSVDPVEEPKITDTTSTANKRSSVFGNLGRRASKAINKLQTPKKENSVPTTSTTTSPATPHVTEPVVDGVTADKVPGVSAAASAAEEIKPEAINVSSTAPVAASA